MTEELQKAVSFEELQKALSFEELQKALSFKGNTCELNIPNEKFLNSLRQRGPGNLAETIMLSKSIIHSIIKERVINH